MTIGEKDTWVAQVDQINRTNTTSIKLDINNLGCDFCSLDDASHHNM
jgi:hypothetical protein